VPYVAFIDRDDFGSACKEEQTRIVIDEIRISKSVRAWTIAFDQSVRGRCFRFGILDEVCAVKGDRRLVCVTITTVAA
jgi:hypothetical protein